MKAFRLIVLILPVFAGIAQAEEITGKVIGIADGDTLIGLQDKQQIKTRVNGINTSESNQAFGIRAKQALTRYGVRHYSFLKEVGAIKVWTTW